MTTRRAVLFGIPAVALGALVFTGRMDDVARLLGARPVPEVRDSDRELITRAVTSLQELLVQAQAAGDDAAAEVILSQLTQLGSRGNASREHPSQWPESIWVAASARAEDAVAASATHVAQVLASLAAGLSQLAEERSR